MSRIPPYAGKFKQLAPFMANGGKRRASWPDMRTCPLNIFGMPIEEKMAQKSHAVVIQRQLNILLSSSRDGLTGDLRRGHHSGRPETYFGGVRRLQEASVSGDRRLRINKDTKLCMSLASRPGNFGARLHNFLYIGEHMGNDKK